MIGLQQLDRRAKGADAVSRVAHRRRRLLQRDLLARDPHPQMRRHINKRVRLVVHHGKADFAVAAKDTLTAKLPRQMWAFSAAFWMSATLRGVAR